MNIHKYSLDNRIVNNNNLLDIYTNKTHIEKDKIPVNDIYRNNNFLSYNTDNPMHSTNHYYNLSTKQLSNKYSSKGRFQDDIFNSYWMNTPSGIKKLIDKKQKYKAKIDTKKNLENYPVHIDNYNIAVPEYVMIRMENEFIRLTKLMQELYIENEKLYNEFQTMEKNKKSNEMSKNDMDTYKKV